MQPQPLNRHTSSPRLGHNLIPIPPLPPRKLSPPVLGSHVGTILGSGHGADHVVCGHGVALVDLLAAALSTPPTPPGADDRQRDGGEGRDADDDADDCAGRDLVPAAAVAAGDA